METPRKFDEETRARAVRMHTDYLADHPELKLGAREHVGGGVDRRLHHPSRHLVRAGNLSDHPPHTHDGIQDRNPQPGRDPGLDRDLATNPALRSSA